MEWISILEPLPKNFCSLRSRKPGFWPGYLLLYYFVYLGHIEDASTEKGKCSWWIDVNTVYLKNNALFVWEETWGPVYRANILELVKLKPPKQSSLRRSAVPLTHFAIGNQFTFLPLSEENAACGRVVSAPIIRIDLRNRYASFFGGMDEFLTAQIYTFMVRIGRWFKENKVSCLKIISAYEYAFLISCFAVRGNSTLIFL